MTEFDNGAQYCWAKIGLRHEEQRACS